MKNFGLYQKSNFCWRYLSAYHFLYGLPLIHQSNIASAISSSVHCPASTPPDAGRLENPGLLPHNSDGLRYGKHLLHCPSRNDILRIGSSVVVSSLIAIARCLAWGCSTRYTCCKIPPPSRIALIALIQPRFTCGNLSTSRSFDLYVDIGHKMQPIRVYPSS